MKAPPRHLSDEDQIVDKNQPPAQCWAWTVTITPSQMDEMRREDNRHRIKVAVQQRTGVAEERMLELGRLVGWTVLALAALCLYIRVDDWSAGTRRHWLRVALATGVLGGGVGWWLLS